jgi:hypothetical protein
MPGKAPTIMIIRHGEKPAGKVAGVNEWGSKSAHHLSVRGWQRAGALACLFAPARGALQNGLLAKPAFIFASAAGDSGIGSSRSRRSEETVVPLAHRIGVPVDLRFSKGQERALAETAQGCDGPVLIAWQHENIGVIANFILGAQGPGQQVPGAKVAPMSWPSDRFDLIFVLSLNPLDGRYSFAQVGQCLLAGDSERLL